MIDSAQTVCDTVDVRETDVSGVIDQTEWTLQNLYFGGHVNRHMDAWSWTVSDECVRQMDGQIADIRVYDWLLDEVQCQMLMENYTTAYRKRIPRANLF